jgi:hypothetical protein
MQPAGHGGPKGRDEEAPGILQSVICTLQSAIGVTFPARQQADSERVTCQLIPTPTPYPSIPWIIQGMIQGIIQGVIQGMIDWMIEGIIDWIIP